MRYSTPLVFVLLLAACGDDAPSGRTDSGARDTGGDDMDAATRDSGRRGDAGPCEEGEACDADGDGCTMDICRRGRCVLGTDSACDDGSSCTVDNCRSTSPTAFECTHVVGTNFCAIDSMCYRDDDANPANLCQACRPSESPMGWTTLTAECDDGNACTTDDTCATGECIGTPSNDAFEPNDVRAEGSMLPAVDDNDTFPSDMVEGTMFPEGDEDWYVYRDNDGNLGRIFPRVDLQGIPEGSNYDLCAFVNCTEHDTEGATCLSGTAATFEGLPGCCSDSASNLDESVKIDHDCDGGVLTSDDTVDVFVRVRQIEGPAACNGGYTLMYGDD